MALMGFYLPESRIALLEEPETDYHKKVGGSNPSQCTQFMTAIQFKKVQELKAKGYLFERHSKALGLVFLIKRGERGGWLTKEVDEKGEVFPKSCLDSFSLVCYSLRNNGGKNEKVCM